jgi:predicted dehydrogenase
MWEQLLKKEDYLPGPPKGVDLNKYGIGIIGCGGIVNIAHLPAYKKAGFKVVACCDVNAEAARSTAEKFDIPFWTTKVEELLERDDVAVIDIALHPPARLEVMKLIAKSPRPVLIQKPLHFDLPQAQEISEVAHKAGITLAINQQARWVSGHKAMRHLIDRGVIGDVYSIQHFMRSYQDQPGTWYQAVKHFNILDHGIHYLDLSRYFAASPAAGSSEWTRLHCTTAMLPDQNGIDPMIYSANVEFGDVGGRASLMASLQFNNIVRAAKGHKFTWWIDGTEGSIWQDGDICIARADDPHTVIRIETEGNWFPDAFQGPMSDLIAAIDEGRKPEVTPQDNFSTVAMTSAMVKSSQEGRVVSRAEMLEQLKEGADLL